MAADALHDLVRYLNLTEFARSGAGDPTYPLTVNDGHIVANYGGLQLGSQFQPLVRLCDGVTVGYESRLRGCTPQGGILGAEAIFVLPTDSTELIYLDRLVRTLHTLNALAQNIRVDLHLTVHPHHVQAVPAEHGKAFEHILRSCGLAPERIVLEVLAPSAVDLAHHVVALTAWQQRGYRVIFDGIGRRGLTRHELLQLRPDGVRLDGLAIALGEYHGLAAVACTLGGQVLVGEIQTWWQLERAQALGADAVSGPLIGALAPAAQPGRLPQPRTVALDRV